MKNGDKIVKYGTDSSGRPIYMTRYMRKWWRRVVKLCGFKPTIVQGAFMLKAGGGAKDSAGYHNGGGCLDIRTWDRTPAELQKMNRVIRELGAGGWIRDERHGMDEHYHLVLGSDFNLSTGAEAQWVDYLNGLNGLSDRRSDYMWRPDPIVRVPVFPNKKPLRSALNASISAAKKLGYDGVVSRLRKVESDVAAK